MLYAIAVVLFVLWLTGVLTSHAVGSIILVLLLITGVIAMLKLIGSLRHEHKTEVRPLSGKRMRSPKLIH